MAQFTITVIGSLSADYYTVTERFPKNGEHLLASDFKQLYSGKGANQALAALRLSHKNPSSDLAIGPEDKSDVSVCMIGVVGDDIHGMAHINVLRDHGIDAHGLLVIKEPTGSVTIIVHSRNGESQVLIYPGANHFLGPADFMTLQSLGDPYPDLLVLQLEMRKETTEQVIRTAKREGIEVVLNAAPAVHLPSHVYDELGHLIVNETEAATLVQQDLATVEGQRIEDGWGSVTDIFLSWGVLHVVVTLDAKGAYFSKELGKGQHVPAGVISEVKDATGAGDTFVGAYAASAVRRNRECGWDMREAVQRGCRAAGCTIQKLGIQDAIPWEDEI